MLASNYQIKVSTEKKCHKNSKKKRWEELLQSKAGGPEEGVTLNWILNAMCGFVL